MTRQEGMGPGAWMLILLPEASVVGKLLGDHRIHVNILRNVIVVFGGVFEGAGTVGRDPNGRMGLLVGFGSRQGLVELPVFALVSDCVLRPCLDNDLERFSANLVPLREGPAPAQEFVR